MNLITQLGVETGRLHVATDEDVLFGSPTSADYRRYLMRMYGFVLPAERSIRSSPVIDGCYENSPAVCKGSGDLSSTM